MKRLFSFILFLSIFSSGKSESLPDTISFWAFYQNDVLLRNFNQMEKNPMLSLDLKENSNEMLLTVKYFRDTPCSACKTHLVIYDDKKRKVLAVSAKGTLTPLSFSLKSLIDKWNRKAVTYFQIYHYEKDSDNRQLLATLKFE